MDDTIKLTNATQASSSLLRVQITNKWKTKLSLLFPSVEKESQNNPTIACKYSFEPGLVQGCKF